MIACEENIDQIQQTVDEIHAITRNAIYEESFEEKTNRFLDHILEFKSNLTGISNDIEEIVARFEKLTWIENPNEDCLKKIRELIDEARKAHSTSIRLYVNINNSSFRNIAKSEVREFKTSLDDIKEAANDLEKAIFIYPNDKEFNDVTAQLLLL